MNKSSKQSPMPPLVIVAVVGGIGGVAEALVGTHWAGCVTIVPIEAGGQPRVTFAVGRAIARRKRLTQTEASMAFFFVRGTDERSVETANILADHVYKLWPTKVGIVVQGGDDARLQLMGNVGGTFCVRSGGEAAQAIAAVIDAMYPMGDMLRPPMGIKPFHKEKTFIKSTPFDSLNMLLSHCELPLPMGADWGKVFPKQLLHIGLSSGLTGLRRLHLTLLIGPDVDFAKVERNMAMVMDRLELWGCRYFWEGYLGWGARRVATPGIRCHALAAWKHPLQPWPTVRQVLARHSWRELVPLVQTVVAEDMANDHWWDEDVKAAHLRAPWTISPVRPALVREVYSVMTKTKYHEPFYCAMPLEPIGGGKLADTAMHDDDDHGLYGYADTPVSINTSASDVQVAAHLLYDATSLMNLYCKEFKLPDEWEATPGVRRLFTSGDETEHRLRFIAESISQYTFADVDAPRSAFVGVQVPEGSPLDDGEYSEFAAALSRMLPFPFTMECETDSDFGDSVWVAMIIETK